MTQPRIPLWVFVILPLAMGFAAMAGDWSVNGNSPFLSLGSAVLMTIIGLVELGLLGRRLAGLIPEWRCFAPSARAEFINWALADEGIILRGIACMFLTGIPGFLLPLLIDKAAPGAYGADWLCTLLGVAIGPRSFGFLAQRRLFLIARRFAQERSENSESVLRAHDPEAQTEATEPVQAAPRLMSEAEDFSPRTIWGQQNPRYWRRIRRHWLVAVLILVCCAASNGWRAVNHQESIVFQRRLRAYPNNSPEQLNAIQASDR